MKYRYRGNFKEGPEQPVPTLTPPDTDITISIQDGKTVCTFVTSTQNGKTVNTVNGIPGARYEIIQTDNPLKEILIVSFNPSETGEEPTKRYFIINWDSNKIDTYEPCCMTPHHPRPRTAITTCIRRAIEAVAIPIAYILRERQKRN